MILLHVVWQIEAENPVQLPVASRIRLIFLHRICVIVEQNWILCYKF